MRRTPLFWLAAAVLAAWVAPAWAQIASHRAAYTLSLGSGKSSGVTGIEGAMYIDWQEVCDGWTISQRMRFQIYDEDGQALDNDISFSSWEAKDGRNYRFALRSVRNGEVAEELMGRAELTAPGQGGRAVFTQPEDEVIELPPGTIFPTEHTVALIRAAQAGEQFFSRPVFDGATLDGALDVSALIMTKLAPENGGGPEIMSDLLKHPSWRMRMAFFKAEERGGEPEYETGMRLFENGVASDFLFDYRDFSIRAQLQKLEALPKQGC